MKIRASYWGQLRRLVGETPGINPEAACNIDRLAEIAVEAPRSMRQQASSEVFMTLGRLPNAAELGAMLGRRIPSTAYGELSLGLRVAPTLRDALRLAADFHHLVVPLVEYSFEEVDRQGRFVIGFRAPIDSKGEATLVMSVACTLDTECACYTGHTGNLVDLLLTPSAKGFERIYRKELSITPDTDHLQNVLIFDPSVLNLPNPFADPDTYIEVRKAYEARKDQHDRELFVAHAVRERVISSIGKPPDFDSVARSLQLTPRQLRLALAKENANYQRIVRECRIKYAGVLLRNPTLSLSQIAERLGYSDLSAFTHAYSRWTGKSPSASRIEMLSRVSSD